MRLIQKGLNLFYFFWASRNAFGQQNMTQKVHTSIEKLTFLGLILKLNCLSLSNTSSMLSNISYIVGENADVIKVQ